MRDDQWEVRVNNFSHSLLSQVYIYRLIGDQIQYLQFNSPEVLIKSEKYNPGAATNMVSAFECMQDEALGIAKAFVAYANAQGFKNGTETFVKGKLEATERHLEDMRTLVFKKK